MLAGVRGWLEAQGELLPAWLDEAFVERARERMRRLLGHWRATPHGSTMTVTWPGGHPD